MFIYNVYDKQFWVSTQKARLPTLIRTNAIVDNEINARNDR